LCESLVSLFCARVIEVIAIEKLIGEKRANVYMLLVLKIEKTSSIHAMVITKAFM